MENIPESVQIGPYTYRIESFPLGSARGTGGDYVDFGGMIINIAHGNSDQAKAVGLLQSVCRVIFSMMGRNPQNSIIEAQRFAPHFASTLAASPEIMAWVMAALLEGRNDKRGFPDVSYQECCEEADASLNAMGRNGYEKDYTVVDDDTRSTTPTKDMDYVVPSVTPRGFYQDAFGHYWQRRVSIRDNTDVMVPVLIAANQPHQEPYRVPESVAKFLDKIEVSPETAIREGVAHIHDGVLKLY